MTRVGKIARLPKRLREELNERLDEGRQGKELVEWLNSLPEVQNLIRIDFRGQPISEQNLSQWRNGGYRDWQTKEERRYMLHDLREEAEEMRFAVEPEETQRHLSVLLTLDLGRALRELIENTADVKERVRGLDRLIGRFAQLRREESQARRVDLEWKRRRNELGSCASGGFGPGSAWGQQETAPEEEMTSESSSKALAKAKRKAGKSPAAKNRGAKKRERAKAESHPVKVTKSEESSDTRQESEAPPQVTVPPEVSNGQAEPSIQDNSSGSHLIKVDQSTGKAPSVEGTSPKSKVENKGAEVEGEGGTCGRSTDSGGADLNQFKPV